MSSLLQSVAEDKPVATPTTPEISALIDQVKSVDGFIKGEDSSPEYSDDLLMDDDATDSSSFPLPDLSALISSGSGSSIGDPTTMKMTSDITSESLSYPGSSLKKRDGSTMDVPSLSASRSRRSDRRRQTLMMDPDTFKQEFMRKEKLNEKKIGQDLMKRRRASLPTLDAGSLSVRSQLKAMYDPSARHMFEQVDTTGLQFICKRVLLSRRKLPLQLVDEMMMASSVFRQTVMDKIMSAESSLSFICKTKSEPRESSAELVPALRAVKEKPHLTGETISKSADITLVSEDMDGEELDSSELITADSLARLSSSDLHRLAKKRRRSKDDSRLIKEKKKEVGKRLVFWLSSFISRANDLHMVVDQLNQLDKHGVDSLACNVLITKFTAEFERHDSYTSRTASSWQKVSERLRILMDPPVCDECDTVMHRRVHETVRREMNNIAGMNFWGQFRHDTVAFCEYCGDKLVDDDLFFECPLCGPNAVIKVIKRGKLKKVFKRKTGSSVCVSCVRGVLAEQRRDSSRRRRTGSRVDLDWKYTEGEEEMGELLLDLEPKRKFIPMTEYPLDESPYPVPDLDDRKSQ